MTPSQPRLHPRRPGPGPWWGLALVAVLLGGANAQAEGVYFSRNDLLKSFFSESGRVHYVRVVTASHAPALRSALGYLPPKESYVVFVATTGERVDGYAVVDDEKGQHLPITFGVKFDPEGKVRRTEVMAYREKYGDEIREARFRRQFHGQGPSAALELGEDVVAISGATISSRSMVRMVRRATVLVQLARRQMSGPPTAQAPGPTPTPRAN